MSTQLVTIQDLYNIEVAEKNDKLVFLLNQPPKNEWIQQHPTIANHRFIPIERIEWLLRTIFKQYRVEITGQGTAFNGVWVSVRVHYVHPITQEWCYHDGIGAKEMQVNKGTSPADLANIKSGAISMAFPIAETLAIKDACHKFGKLFGSDIDRKTDTENNIDLTIHSFDEKHPNWLKACEAIKSGNYKADEILAKYKNVSEDVKQYLKDLENGTV